MIFNLKEILGAEAITKNICVKRFNNGENWGFAMISASKNQEVFPSKVYDFRGFADL
jgi:hypothetical protein